VDELVELEGVELEGVELEGVELEGVELEGVELGGVDDVGELLHPATSPAITASAEPAVTICLGFTFLLPFRIKASVMNDVDD